MGSRTSQTLPPPLEAGRQRFEHWRSERAPRTRIPEALWNLASELAVEFGVHRTAKVLRLNYGALKARVAIGQSENSSTPPPTPFVELFPGTALNARACSVEFEDGHGARMRIQLEEADATLLGALAEAFVRGQR